MELINLGYSKELTNFIIENDKPTPNNSESFEKFISKDLKGDVRKDKLIESIFIHNLENLMFSYKSDEIGGRAILQTGSLSFLFENTSQIEGYSPLNKRYKHDVEKDTELIITGDLGSKKVLSDKTLEEISSENNYVTKLMKENSAVYVLDLTHKNAIKIWQNLSEDYNKLLRNRPLLTRKFVKGENVTIKYVDKFNEHNLISYTALNQIVLSDNSEELVKLFKNLLDNYITLFSLEICKIIKEKRTDELLLNEDDDSLEEKSGSFKEQKNLYNIRISPKSKKPIFPLNNCLNFLKDLGLIKIKGDNREYIHNEKSIQDLINLRKIDFDRNELESIENGLHKTSSKLENKGVRTHKLLIEYMRDFRNKPQINKK